MTEEQRQLAELIQLREDIVTKHVIGQTEIKNHLGYCFALCGKRTSTDPANAERWSAHLNAWRAGHMAMNDLPGLMLENRLALIDDMIAFLQGYIDNSN
jgi:hypothetical protein